jgi:hypothetical protein
MFQQGPLPKLPPLVIRARLARRSSSPRLGRLTDRNQTRNRSEIRGRPARPTRRPQISNDQDQLQESETASFSDCHRYRPIGRHGSANSSANSLPAMQMPTREGERAFAIPPDIEPPLVPAHPAIQTLQPRELGLQDQQLPRVGGRNVASTGGDVVRSLDR